MPTPSSVTIQFEISDASISQFYRDIYLEQIRLRLRPKNLPWILLAALFMPLIFNPLHLLEQSSISWWSLGVLLLILLVLLVVVIGWFFFCIRLPAQHQARLATQTNRQIVLHASNTGLRIHTGAGQLIIDWKEVEKLVQMGRFWLLYFRSGRKIPIPEQCMGAEALNFLQKQLTLPENADGMN